MVLELAMAGMLQCSLVTQRIKGEDLYCFYQCVDTTREFASTLKNYRCPRTIYADRAALLFKHSSVMRVSFFNMPKIDPGS